MIGKMSQSGLRPSALGTTVQSSTYGSTIPVIYGRTKTALYLIWSANLRKSGGGKKYKKTKGKKSVPNFVQNVDFLIGHNPIVCALTAWENQNQRFPMDFTSQTFPVDLAVAIADDLFYAVVGVTFRKSLSATYDDYGGQGPRTITGDFDIPMWNAAFSGPDPTDPHNFRRYPYLYRWVPGHTGTVYFDYAFNGLEGNVTIYYARADTLSLTGNKMTAPNRGLAPISRLNLSFEGVLGEGPEFDDFGGQQILYPQYAGVGSDAYDMGATQTMPNVWLEVLGSYPRYPNGDADYADMVEDIIKQGMGQSGFTATGQPFNTVQRGLGAFEFPGTIQKKTMWNLEAFLHRPMQLDNPVTSGNYLVAAATSFLVGTITINDDQFGGWTKVFPDGLGYQVWYRLSTGGSPIVSIDGAYGIAWTLSLMEIGGVDSIDAVASDNGTGVNHVPITTSNEKGQPALILGFGFYPVGTGTRPPRNPLWRPVISKTALDDGSDPQITSRVVYAPGTYSVEFPSHISDCFAVAMIAFKGSNPPSFPKPLGDILDKDSLELVRDQCAANGLHGSLLMDSQRKASEWLEMLYQAMNAAPVWSGFKLKSIPYSEVSTLANGVGYTAPTSTGPVADLQESDFIAPDPDSPLITVERTAQVDVPNILQFQFPNRNSDYNDVIIQQPEAGSIALFGSRKDEPRQFRCIQDPVVARMLLGIAVRRRNYLRNTYKFKVVARWKLLEAMDLITIPLSATLPTVQGMPVTLDRIPVRLTKAEEDSEYAIDCEAEPFIYGCHAPVELPVTDAQPNRTDIGFGPGVINPPIIFEPPPRLSSELNQNQLWVVVSADSAFSNYGGSLVYLSTDGGASYFNVGQTIGNAITGFSENDWPAAADPDLTNDLNVDLSESKGSLSSYLVPDEDAFLYPCYIEGGTDAIPYELLAYAVADLTAPYKYTLSASGGNKLRRSVFGAPTPGVGVDHPSDSRFAFIGNGAPGILKLPLDPVWIGKELHFKIVPYNQFGGGLQALGDATDYTYTPGGSTGNVNPSTQDYTVVPARPLSQPSATEIDMVDVQVVFPGQVVRYNARTFTISAPTTPTRYYVTVHDPMRLGDIGTVLTRDFRCQTTLVLNDPSGPIDSIGVWTLIGSIVALPGGAGSQDTDGGLVGGRPPVVGAIIGYAIDIPSGGAITPDLATALAHEVTLTSGSAITINDPVLDGDPPPAGLVFSVTIVQDATGSRPTPTWGSNYVGVTGYEIGGDPNARSTFTFIVTAAGKFARYASPDINIT